MWAVAGVLLGAFALLVLVGGRVGAHSHLLGAIIGLCAALWLGAMAILGYGQALLWTLLAVDSTATVTIGLIARSALRHPAPHHRHSGVEGREGIAMSDLAPEGIVRVGGEDWSAIALNGAIHRGERIQVVEGKGVRIGVWGLGMLDAQDSENPQLGEKRTGTPW